MPLNGTQPDGLRYFSLSAMISITRDQALEVGDAALTVAAHSASMMACRTLSRATSSTIHG